MSNQSNINNGLFLAKLSLGRLSLKYVNYITYGYTKKAEDTYEKLVFLKGVIRIFNDYSTKGNSFIKDGVLNKFNKKALLSTKNPLSLNSNSGCGNLSSENSNCFSESDLCNLFDKVKSIYSTC